MAEQLIWQCLVEDPALFLRTFLEKLTNRDRRVREFWSFAETEHPNPERNNTSED